MSSSFLASSGELVLMNSELVFVADGFGDEADVYSVSAFDVESGDLVWQRDDLTEGVDDVFLQALEGEDLIVNGQYKSITSVDAATGEMTWSFQFPEGYGAVRSTVSGGQLVVATTAASEGDLRPPIVYSVDMEDGSLLWQNELTKGTQVQWHSPPTAEGLVFVASTPNYSGSSTGNMLHALDLETGDIRWAKDLGGDEGYHFYPNLVASGVLVIQAPTSDITGLDPTNGSELWTYTQANPLGVSPDGHVFAFDGAIVQLDARTGEASPLVDQLSLDGFRPSAAVAQHGQLVLMGSDGVRSYDLETLDGVWGWWPASITATPAVAEDKAAVVTGEPAVSVIVFDVS